MYKYILIFLFSCTQTTERGQLMEPIKAPERYNYQVLARPDFPEFPNQIKFIGNWTHMTIEEHGKTGSFANTNQDTARYEFWGYGVQIRTELMAGHAAYKVFIDGKYIRSVNVKNDINTTLNLTYSNLDLVSGNHVLELVPDGGYFVLNTITIHYHADPTPGDVPCDSTVINYIDSIRWIVKDTTIIHYKDTMVIHYDTLQPKIYINADDIIYQLN